MQIKDITVEAQDLATVRGGNSNFNNFVGGNATAAVSVGGRRNRSIHSGTSVTVENVAANLVEQKGSIRDHHQFDWSLSIDSSIFSAGRGRR